MSGKELSATIREQVATDIVKDKLSLCLAVILIGSDPASEKYVGIKERACMAVGIDFKMFRFKENDKQALVLQLIQKLNNDNKITGIIVQLPIPVVFDTNELLEAIAPAKDVDGLNSINLGRLMKRMPGLFPATPEGVINLCKYYQIPLVGSKVAMVGQSNLVGRPLSIMLLNEKSTVSIASSKTKNLKELTLNSDIVISAVGKPSLIKASMLNKGTVVIDIGTSVIEGKIVGDVDFDKVSKKASYITPSIGGVGPMTVAMLISNTLKAYRLDN
ncbi:MAG: bifunctional 5,10-methylenetetrahydrofolate dehydrogenase/5,10-methenyltetrahydrofolate cyclohydrolase [bacterium]